MDTFLNFLLNEAGLKNAIKSGNRGDRKKEATKQSLRAARKNVEAQAREDFADNLKNNPDLRASIDMSRNSLKDSANKNTLNARALNAALSSESQPTSDDKISDVVSLIRKSIKLR
jgi:hypothetical protein